VLLIFPRNAEKGAGFVRLLFRVYLLKIKRWNALCFDLGILQNILIEPRHKGFRAVEAKCLCAARRSNPVIMLGR